MPKRECFRCGANISSNHLFGGLISGTYVDFVNKSTGSARLPLCIECIQLINDSINGSIDNFDLSSLS